MWVQVNTDGFVPSYIKQKNNWSCGPTAIYNARVWAGEKLTRKRDLPAIIRKCGSNEFGTEYEVLANVLRFYLKRKKIKVYSADTTSVDVLYDILRAPYRAALLHYAWDKNNTTDAHVTLCVGVHQQKFVCVNDASVGPWAAITKAAVRKYLKHPETGAAILLEKQHAG